MNYFFYGPDDFLVQQAARHQSESLAAKGGRIFCFDLAETEQLELWREELRTLSFFNEPRIFLMRGVFVNPAAAATLQDFLKDQPLAKQQPSPSLIISQAGSAADLSKKHSRLFSFLVENVQVKAFDYQTGLKLEQWAAAQSQDLKLKISSAVIRQLLIKVAWSAARTYQELVKLAAFKAARDSRGQLLHPGPIILEELEKVVEQEVSVDNFQLAEAIVRGERAKAVVWMHHYLSKGQDPHPMFGLLVFQFRNLLWIKSLIKEGVSYARLAGLTNLHPWVIKKTYAQINKFSLSELADIYRRLGAVERELKTGQGDAFFSLLFLCPASHGL